MSNDPVVITRKGLYDQVWNEPIVRIAKRLGLSDRGLGKLCSRHDIPVPPRGWWARKRHGKRVRQTPFGHPETADAQIVISGSPGREDGSGDPPELERERTPEWKIVVAPDLRITNRLVKATGAEIRRHWSKRPDQAVGRAPTERVAPSSILHTSVSRSLLPRSLRIWQALLDAFERRGYGLEFTPSGATVVVVLGEPFEIALVERRKQVFVSSTWGRSMKYEPMGLLFLRVGGSYSSSGTADNPPHFVEDRLNRFVAGLIRRAVQAKRARAVYQDREERWRIEDDRRRHQERERLSEVVRIRYLRNLAAKWARDRRLAQFLSHVEERVQVEENPERRARAARWLAWAVEHSRQRDPASTFFTDDWPEAELPPPAWMPCNWA